MFKIDFLSIGHITTDLYPEEQMIGGSVVYSALTSYHLGYSTGIITSFGADFSGEGVLKDIYIVNSISRHTTTFCNIYKDGERSQIISHVARKIKAEQIPRNWKDIPMVHICPVVNEIEESIFLQFPNSLVCLTPQGLMRKWGKDGKVYAQRWLPSKKILSNLDVIIFSEEDIKPFPEVVDYYKSAVKIVILTCGKKGSIVFTKNRKYYISVTPVKEKDPTGAGDVFAAAFIIKYYETEDPFIAAHFASHIASFAVTEKGINGITKIKLSHKAANRYRRLLTEKI